MKPYTLIDVLRVPWNHRFKFVFVAASVLVIAIVAIRVWPRSYGSEAKLLVRLGRENVTLDPTANIGKLAAVQSSRDSEINSAVEFLSSRVLVERVVKNLSPEWDTTATEETLSEKPDPLEVAMGKLVGAVKSALGEDLEVSEAERAITKLHRKIDISTTKKQSDIIIASCVADSPELAQSVLQGLIDVYLEEHADASNVEGSFSFFEKQTRQIEGQLLEARQELRDIKNSGGIASLAAQQTSLEQQIADLQKQVYVVDAAAQASSAKRKAMEQMVTSMPERLELETGSGFDNQAADDMRAEFYRLQIAQLDAESKLTEGHPKLSAIRQQSQKAAEILNKQSTTRTRATMALNPRRQQVELLLITEQANGVGLLAESSAMKEKLASAREALRQLNEHEMSINTIQNRIALLDESYKRYRENLEHARVNEALEKEELSNIAVVQPPTLIVKPVAPKKLQLLILSLCASVMSGFAVAFLAEQMNQPLDSPSSVEAEVELPVLVSVPKKSVLRKSFAGSELVGATRDQQ